MDPAPDNDRYDKIIILVGMGLYWFIITLAQVLIAPTGPAWGVMFMLTSIGWGVGMLYWCTADSKERGEELSTAAKVAIVAFGIFALIWYLFHTRGAAGGSRALGWLFLYAAAGFVLVTMAVALTLTVLHLAGIRPIM